ncbi:MAG: right-handed parallel beta-helix repeat-containing protein [Planctomycetota bacterium]|jgi:hypothetical protein
MRTRIVLFSLVAACLTLNSPVLAIDRLVPSQYSTIQTGIDAAVNGDDVIVAPGTYTGDDNRDIDFKGKAITVRSTKPNDPNVVAATVIDCQNVSGHRGFYFHSGEGPSSVISGLTITGGRSTSGSGIYCSGSSPTIENCIITNNEVTSGSNAYGGGICCTGGSSPIISNCTISNNTVLGNWTYGGGVSCNSGSNPTIENCTISYNVMQSGDYHNSCGGGVYCSSDGIAAIDNCIINNNIAIGGKGYYDDMRPTGIPPGDGKGGGIYGRVDISNSVVRENDVRFVREGEWPWEVFGGGLYCIGSCSITNCLITDHDLWYINDPIELYGPAIYCHPGSNVTITNCTISNNRFGDPAMVDCKGTAQVTITNSILWNNEPGDDVKSDFSVTYSCIEQIVSGIGNIHTDPRFVSGPEGDYYLSQIAAGQVSDSPCVDAGSDTAANLGMDIYTTRTDEMGDEEIVDMGYHYPAIIEYGCPDIDGDEDVDFFDYAWLSMGLFYETSKQIPRGSVVVDGDLSDWPESVEWIKLDKVYYGSPNDLTEARFALQWDANTNKVYAAVIVNDTNHFFLDEYVSWDASDRIEIYSQGDAEDGTGWNEIYDVAQQYCVAPDTSDGNWATWAEGETLGDDVGLEYAVDVNGAQIIYEVGVRQFDDYGVFGGTETIVTKLHTGHVMGFDIVASTRWDTTNFGMLSENLMTGKYKDAGKFGKYILVDRIFSADLDGNGSNNYADLVILFESWLWGK